MKQKILLFPHIPKTAGSTLGHPLHRQYPTSSHYLINGKEPIRSIKQYKSLTAYEKNRYQCITGHMPFGLHKYCNLPAVYTTVLRDPVARILSLYNHIVRDKEHYLYDRVVNNKISLIDFVSSDLTLEISNFQTYQLVGLDHIDYEEGSIEINESLFQVAKNNIEEYFPIVGLTETFDESLLLMKDIFGWHDVFYTRRKTAPSYVGVRNIDQTIVEVIKERNQFDIKLYEYARKRLYKQINEKGRYFDSRVRWFKNCNSVYNTLRRIKHYPAASILWSILVKSVKKHEV